jgi:transcriptional regulator with PAS, ATPase and Fis domain/CHASE2 domain-containing sensor protein
MIGKTYQRIHANLIPFLAITLIWCILQSLPTSFNEWLENFSSDILFKLRGNRQLTDDILYVFIGQEDANELGGWPITRDYYGYLTHLSNKAGAKTVAFDILFDRNQYSYQEFDEVMRDFFKETNNICLPMTFGELAIAQPQLNANFRIPEGNQPAFPIPELLESAAAIGFSNLGKQSTIRKIPLIANFQDTVIFSFGLEMARLYLDGEIISTQNTAYILLANDEGKTIKIPTDRRGNIRLNHFGDLENVNHISFVELLQNLDEISNPLDLSNKMIVVGVTVPGSAILKGTPLTENLPASLIHVTVAENIIHQNFLRSITLFAKLLIILLFVLFVFLSWKEPKSKFVFLLGFGFLILYWLVCLITFSLYHTILPLVFPTLAFITAFLYLQLIESRKVKVEHQNVKILFEEQLSEKEAQLQQAKKQLDKYRSELKSQEKQSQELQELSLQREREILQLENELRDLHAYIIPQKPHAREDFFDIIHSPSSKLTQVLELVNRIRDDDIPVLIVGETGSGKEMIARAIHKTSRRKNKPFIAINCGALTETLLESELFGHEKGSFTGAISKRRGRFELANGGTIFLDEISETTPSFQAKLLRILQEGSFERVGGESNLQVDVRIIAASNKNLQTELERGNFRSDLFYRLNGFPINLPSLRERKEDIPLLVNHFLSKYDYKQVKNISDQAIEFLKRYSWPGNVRELENMVRRAAILAQSDHRDLIRLTDLAPEIINSSSQTETDKKYYPLETQILDILRSYKFSHSAISQTAKTLGNKDRGTVTEYFRGICFEELVKARFDSKEAATNIAASSDENVVEKIEKKIQDYLNNLMPLPDTTQTGMNNLTNLPQFKGLPKKYHHALLQVIKHLKINS